MPSPLELLSHVGGSLINNETPMRPPTNEHDAAIHRSRNRLIAGGLVGVIGLGALGAYYLDSSFNDVVNRFIGSSTPGLAVDAQAEVDNISITEPVQLVDAQGFGTATIIKQARAGGYDVSDTERKATGTVNEEMTASLLPGGLSLVVLHDKHGNITGLESKVQESDLVFGNADTVRSAHDASSSDAFLSRVAGVFDSASDAKLIAESEVVAQNDLESTCGPVLDNFLDTAIQQDTDSLLTFDEQTFPGDKSIQALVAVESSDNVVYQSDPSFVPANGHRIKPELSDQFSLDVPVLMDKQDVGHDLSVSYRAIKLNEPLVCGLSKLAIHEVAMPRSAVHIS